MQQLHNIVLGAPDAKSFEVPDGYEKIEPPQPTGAKANAQTGTAPEGLPVNGPHPQEQMPPVQMPSNQGMPTQQMPLRQGMPLYQGQMQPQPGTPAQSGPQTEQQKPGGSTQVTPPAGPMPPPGASGPFMGGPKGPYGNPWFEPPPFGPYGGPRPYAPAAAFEGQSNQSRDQGKKP